MTNITLFNTENPLKVRLKLYFMPLGREDKGADKSQVSLLEWMELRAKNAERMAQEAGRTQTVNAKGFITAAKHLECYIKSWGRGKTVTLADADKEFCRGFAEHLRHVPNRLGGKLSSNTRFLYFSKFSAAMNAAVRAGLIPSNPATLLDKTDRPRFRQTERNYLTEEELQKLINTPNSHSESDVARAFYFPASVALGGVTFPPLSGETSAPAEQVCK